MWGSISSFYTSREWLNLRKQLMIERENESGDIICEYCHKPIDNKDEVIGHHTEMLTIDNVNDYNVSLNPELIQLVHHKCHDKIHRRFGHFNQHIYIVYGPPLSGKKTWVKNNASRDDIVISMDLLNQAITGGSMYDNSNNTRGEVFAVHDYLLSRIKDRIGMRKAHNIYIIGGYPRRAELEEMVNVFGAHPILMNATKEECLLRLESMMGIDKVAYRKYIEEWFFVYNY